MFNHKKLFHMRKTFLLQLVAICIAAFAIVSCEKTNGPVNPGDGGDSTTVEPGTDSTIVKTSMFDFEVLEIDPAYITAKVTPEDQQLKYFWSAIPKAAYEGTYHSDITAAALATVNLWKESFADYGYMSFEEMYNDQISTGTQTSTFGGYTQMTELYLLAFGVDETGTLTTDVEMSELYITGKVEPSDNTFKISLVDETIIRVEPSNDDPYCFYVMPKEGGFDNYDSPEAIADEYLEVNASALNVLITSGIDQRNYFEVFETYGTGTYVAFAFGAYAGARTTDVETLEIEYEEYVPDPETGNGFTKLTGDVAFEASNAYWEDGMIDYSDNASTVYLAIQAKSSYGSDETRLGLYIQLDNMSKFPYNMQGEYQVSSSLKAGTVVKGWRDEDYNQDGSYYYEKDSYSWDATVDSGKLTITANGDGTYTIVADLYDVDGNSISTEYSGMIEVSEDW